MKIEFNLEKKNLTKEVLKINDVPVTLLPGRMFFKEKNKKVYRIQYDDKEFTLETKEVIIEVTKNKKLIINFWI